MTSVPPTRHQRSSGSTLADNQALPHTASSVEDWINGVSDIEDRGLLSRLTSCETPLKDDDQLTIFDDIEENIEPDGAPPGGCPLIIAQSVIIWHQGNNS
ncbi:hypothetical protein HYQ46_005501 [Verticillium longisporum]|nr:hypothetical protein HYQ46_005501 [Verticillium longisporum]